MEETILGLTDEEIKEMERKLKAKSFIFDDEEQSFGITKILKLAGFMLTDGTMINFYEDDGLPLHQQFRNIDHRDVEMVLPKELYFDFSTPTDRLEYFMQQSGAIRIRYEGKGEVNIEAAGHSPTKTQLKKIFKAAKDCDVSTVVFEYNSPKWYNVGEGWTFSEHKVNGEIEISVFRTTQDFINWVNNIIKKSEEK